MVVTSDGYLRPSITGPISSIEDSLIDKVCPGGQLDGPGNGQPFATAWGPILDVQVGFALDPDLRFKASSGGVVSALAQYMLDSRQADYVMHVGADPEVPWLNAVQESREQADVLTGAGSRYAPSAPLGSIVQRLEQPGRAVVVGKPCDIAGLRMYSRHNPLVDRKVALMLTFMCGGVPSTRGVDLVLNRMGVRKEDVVSFRYRGHGWPGEACATLRNGERRTLSYAETWGHILSNHVQKRCKICPDGVGMFGDVVCGDGWYGDERGYPKFDEQDGRSIILVRTAKGAAIVDGAASAEAIKLAASSLVEVGRMQPYQLKRTRLTLSRLGAMAVLGRAVPRYRGLRLVRAALEAGLMANIRSFVGAVRRILLDKL
jgi:coenzyme F420 hydrogenase subunit beta